MGTRYCPFTLSSRCTLAGCITESRSRPRIQDTPTWDLGVPNSGLTTVSNTCPQMILHGQCGNADSPLHYCRMSSKILTSSHWCANSIPNFNRNSQKYLQALPNVLKEKNVPIENPISIPVPHCFNFGGFLVYFSVNLSKLSSFLQSFMLRCPEFRFIL